MTSSRDYSLNLYYRTLVVTRVVAMSVYLSASRLSVDSAATGEHWREHTSTSTHRHAIDATRDGRTLAIYSLNLYYAPLPVIMCMGPRHREDPSVDTVPRELRQRSNVVGIVVVDAH